MEQKTPSKVSTIVLNYKNLSATLDCIDSLKNCVTKSFLLEVIVVDNGSDDGSALALSKIKDIELVENQKNLGFAGGMNSGIKYAIKRNSDYVVLLNNDTTVDKMLLENLLKGAREADIISPKIYFAPGYEFHKSRYKESERGKVIWYAGAKIDWQNILGVHTDVDEVDHGQFNKNKFVDLATGCCMLIKREVIEKIGYLDEKYFLYLEDMDYCVRAAKNNFKIMFVANAIVWHRNAASAGGSGSELQDYYISRNRLLFATKYASLNIKLALFKHLLLQFNKMQKRKALVDFLTFNYGRGSF